MTYTLFYSPGACSLSCHIALEESGLPYERRRFHATKGGTESPEYRAINPRGRVPALRLSDGSILTEAAAILGFVADQVPEKELLPAHGTLDYARAREWMGFLASSVHPAIRSVFPSGQARRRRRREGRGAGARSSLARELLRRYRGTPCGSTVRGR